MAMKVIINADDLAISTEVNKKISELVERRVVTSATIMANGPALDQAVEIALSKPLCSYGVHLNITEFKPLTDTKELEPLIGKDGCFNGRARHISLSSPVRDAIYRELEAQIELISSLGIQISHIDSHHHIHTIPGLFHVIKNIQKRFGINKVRITKNVFSDNQKAPISHKIKKKCWNFALRKILKTITTTSFCEFNTFIDAVQDGMVRDDVESIELMVHPGAKECEAETFLLETDWEIFCPFQVTLISYNDL